MKPVLQISGFTPFKILLKESPEFQNFLEQMGGATMLTICNKSQVYNNIMNMTIFEFVQQTSAKLLPSSSRKMNLITFQNR
jgi:hypothetical protein